MQSQPCSCPSSAVACLRILIDILDLVSRMVIGPDVCDTCNIFAAHYMHVEIMWYDCRLFALEDYLEFSLLLLMLLLLLNHLMSEIMPDSCSYDDESYYYSRLFHSSCFPSDILNPNIIIFLPSLLFLL